MVCIKSLSVCASPRAHTQTNKSAGTRIHVHAWLHILRMYIFTYVRIKEICVNE